MSSFAGIDQAFEEFYYSKQIDPRFCGVNTKNFTKYLAKKNLFDKKMKVLKIESPRNPWTFGRLVAINSRWGKEMNGNFVAKYIHHTFLVYQGQVYDFSFNDQPLILSFNQYLKEMFIPKSPFMINGADFRTRGKGPYYTIQDAYDEIQSSEYSLYTTNENGDHIPFLDKVSLEEVFPHIL